MMLLLCMVHSQIVSTNSGRAAASRERGAKPQRSKRRRCHLNKKRTHHNPRKIIDLFFYLSQISYFLFNYFIRLSIFFFFHFLTQILYNFSSYPVVQEAKFYHYAGSEEANTIDDDEISSSVRFGKNVVIQEPINNTAPIQVSYQKKL